MIHFHRTQDTYTQYLIMTFSGVSFYYKTCIRSLILKYVKERRSITTELKYLSADCNY